MTNEQHHTDIQRSTSSTLPGLLTADQARVVPSGMPPNMLLDTKEAAAYLGVSKKTLEAWRSTGRYPLRYVKVGNRVRYRLRDLDEWLASRLQEHTGQGERGQA